MKMLLGNDLGDRHVSQIVCLRRETSNCNSETVKLLYKF